MSKSIFSNVTAQGQRLYRGAKKRLYADGLLDMSVDLAVDKVSKKYSKAYDKMYSDAQKIDKATGKMFEDMTGMKSDKGVASVMRDNKKRMQSMNKDTVSNLGLKYSKETSSKINDTVVSKSIVDADGVPSGNTKKAYDSAMRKTKAEINAGTAKNLFKGYYSDPLKVGRQLASSGVSFKDNLSLQKATARIGTTAVAGVGVVGGMAYSSSRREDLKG